MVFPVSQEFSDNPSKAIIFATSSGTVRRFPGFSFKASSIIFSFSGIFLRAGVSVTPALRKIPEYDKMIELALKLNPGNRLTVPEDVAKIIALLGLSENSWLTGNTIRVDGGEDITG